MGGAKIPNSLMQIYGTIPRKAEFKYFNAQWADSKENQQK